MQVIEQLVRPKTGQDEDCEDAILVTDHFAAIIDGATNKSERHYDGTTPGRKAARIISDGIEQMPRDIDMEGAVQWLTECVFSFYRESRLVDRVREHPAERLTAAVVIYSAAQGEVWLVGDCQFMVDESRYGNDKYIDSVLSSMRALVLELALVNGLEVDQLRRQDIGRDFIRPVLAEQAKFQNLSADNPYAYAAIDGFPIDLVRVVRVKIPTSTDRLVLASDGYPQLHPTLQESEAALEEIIEADPLCMRIFKSTKGVGASQQSFDDRAYLHLAI